jgi:hypothetical protein
MTDASDVESFGDPALAEAVAASTAEIAAILAEDLGAFGDSLAADVIVNSPLGTINRRGDTLAAFEHGLSDTTHSTGELNTRAGLANSSSS